MNALQLIDLAWNLKIKSEELDTWVHDVASDIASATNNGGIGTQIDFLVKHCGHDTTEEGLRETK